MTIIELDVSLCSWVMCVVWMLAYLAELAIPLTFSFLFFSFLCSNRNYAIAKVSLFPWIYIQWISFRSSILPMSLHFFWHRFFFDIFFFSRTISLFMELFFLVNRLPYLTHIVDAFDAGCWQTEHGTAISSLIAFETNWTDTFEDKTNWSSPTKFVLVCQIRTWKLYIH